MSAQKLHESYWGHFPVVPSQVFPSYSSAQRPPTQGGALAKIKERRAALKALQANGGSS